MLEALRRLFGGGTKSNASPVDENTKRIHELEAEGLIAATSPELHARNKAQTDAMSTQELLNTRDKRVPQDLPVKKIEAALRDRENTARIHELEGQGHTARTSSELHSRNVAQTNSMSTSQLQQTRAARVAQGLPVGKIDAALRDR